MSDTTTPKPGATLTAAQANALPVGSVVDYADGGASNPVYRDGEGYWRFEHDNSMVGGAKELISPPYTIIRVGPSAAETPVETSAETPVLHIDPAAIAEALDKAIPQWREEGFTVAQAIRVLRQRYEMQMQVCMYQGDSAAASAKHVARLEAERERLENLVAQYKQGEDDAAGRINYETERREELKAQVAALTAERDAAIREISKSCATMAKSHAEEVKGLTTERDAALQRAEKAEAAEREWMAKGSQIDADMDDLREERDDALAFARTMEVACKELRSRLIVPEGVRDWPKGIDFVNVPVHVLASVKCFILSLGWRIHQPAVAPSPLPSVAQLAASIEALNERLAALEGKG